MTANIPPRKDINHGMTAPTGPHISDAVRAKLTDLDPELAAGVRRVADSK
jgi:hypothetical protein